MSFGLDNASICARKSDDVSSYKSVQYIEFNEKEIKK